MKKLLVLGLIVLLSSGCVSKPEPWTPDSPADSLTDSRTRNLDGHDDVRTPDMRLRGEVGEMVDAKGVDLVDTGSKDSELVTVDVVDDGVCSPDCTDKVCGDDGCGSSCGECEVGQTCEAGLCSKSGCGALSFDGEDDYVEIPHSDELTLADTFTVELWFNAKTTTSDRSLLRKGPGAANYFVWLRPDMTLSGGMYVLGADKAAYFTEATVPIEADVWHHFAMTYSGESLLAYVDGTIYASIDVPGTAYTNDHPVTFGYGYPESYSNSYFSGTLSQVRLWGRALSQTELNEKSQEKLVATEEDGLVGEWRFAEDQGAILFDSAGSNDGAVHGATWASAPSNEVCCVPDCEGKDCGEDGCGGECGTCNQGFQCGWGQCVCEEPQAPGLIEWGHTFEKPGIELGGGTVRSGDYYYVSGHVSDNGKDGFLAQFALDGSLNWSKTFGGDSLDTLSSVVAVEDGVLAGGYTMSNGAAGVDAWLLRISAQGEVLWEETYGGEGYDEIFAVEACKDGGYVLAGVTTTEAEGSWDFWLCRVTEEGELLWMNPYGGPEEDWPLSGVVETADGGFVAVGGTKSFGAGDKDMWLVKVDGAGSMVWNKTYGTDGTDNGSGVAALKDGGFAIIGSSPSGPQFIRTDSSGNEVWQKAIGGLGDAPHGVVEMADGGFIVQGNTTSMGAGSHDFWLLRLDGMGNQLWETAFGDEYSNVSTDFAVLPEGQFIIAGHITYANSEEMDIQVLVTSSECCKPVCDGKECGDDGCGGSCGDCAGTCDEDYFVCVPEGWVLVKADEFQMGVANDEFCGGQGGSSSHKVVITRPFFVEATEVTQAEWTDTMKTSPFYFTDCGETCPAENVSWYGAVAYCNKLSELHGLDPCYQIDGDQVSWPDGLDCKGYRLPTEAEWEYFARAGTTTPLFNGELKDCKCGQDANLDEIGWYCGNSTADYGQCIDASEKGGVICAGTHPVAQKKPNQWGLYDTAGGVYEWVWDRYQDDFYGLGPTEDPTGPDAGEDRCLRGGCFAHSASGTRPSIRFSYAPKVPSASNGFRPVRTVP